VREAQRLSIPIFAMVDTNSNPDGIDFVIPANDDASQSIDLIIGLMCEAIKDGLSDRKVEREKDETDEKPFTLKKSGRKAVVKIIVEDDLEEADEKEDLLDSKVSDLLIDEDLLDEEDLNDEETIDEEIVDEDVIDIK
jgi:small subunit ribosomal protein S2